MLPWPTYIIDLILKILLILPHGCNTIVSLEKIAMIVINFHVFDINGKSAADMLPTQFIVTSKWRCTCSPFEM